MLDRSILKGLLNPALSDLYSAHEMAFVNKIVGKESIYKRDAIKLFHTRGLYKLNSLELISEEGFFKNDELARGRSHS